MSILAVQVLDNEQTHINRKEAVPAFDWLRYVLASIVVLSHGGVIFPGPINGSLAVAVFLALSGWLIGGILLQTEKADIPKFFWNRSTRIWVPYFASVILLYSVAAVKEGVSTDWLTHLFYDVTFTHYTFVRLPYDLNLMPLKGTATHFWSISVEEQFYLIAPIIILYVKCGKSILTWSVIFASLMVNGSVFSPIAGGVFAALLNYRYTIVERPVSRLIAMATTIIALINLFFWNVEPWRSIFSISIVLTLAIPGRRRPLGLLAGGISYPLYLING